MSLRLRYAANEGAMQSTWKTAVVVLVEEQAPSQYKALGAQFLPTKASMETHTTR